MAPAASRRSSTSSDAVIAAILDWAATRRRWPLPRRPALPRCRRQPARHERGATAGGAAVTESAPAATGPCIARMTLVAPRHRPRPRRRSRASRSWTAWLPRHSPLARVGLICFTLLVACASLYPFTGWVRQRHLADGLPDRAQAALHHRVRPDDQRARLLPVRCAGRCWRCIPRISGARATLIALVAGALLSAVMEALQTWLPSRISPNIDLDYQRARGLAGRGHGGAVLPARWSIAARYAACAWRGFNPCELCDPAGAVLATRADLSAGAPARGMGGIVREWPTDPDSRPMEILQGYFPALLDWQNNVGLRPDDMEAQPMLETMAHRVAAGSARGCSRRWRCGAPRRCCASWPGGSPSRCCSSATVAELAVRGREHLQLAVRSGPLRR